MTTDRRPKINVLMPVCEEMGSRTRERAGASSPIAYNGGNWFSRHVAHRPQRLPSFLPGAPMKTFEISSSWLPWVCFAGTLIVFVFYLGHLPPKGYFGMFRDDSLYFSSAKALAEGRGYVIPNLPGAPRQTKYPVLYPWLLSWIWRWQPSFPSNITPAAWMTGLFGCWFLVAAFELLRRLKGVGDWSAFIVVSLCAFEFYVLVLSRALLSDVPFAAFALTAALVGDAAMRTQARPAWVVTAGVLAGLSLMTRSVGVAVVAGVVAAALYRRANRQAALFCLTTAPFFLACFWLSRPSVASAPAWLAEGVRTAFPGWGQSVLYYTDYASFWRFCVPRLSVFWTMLELNLESLVQGDTFHLLEPTLRLRNSLASNVVGGVLLAWAVAGIVRQARNHEWKPIHFILILYSAIMLTWNYPNYDRFFLPFAPLFFMGMWVEGKHLVRLTLASQGRTHPLGERLLGGMLLTALAGLVGIALWNYVRGDRPQMLAWAKERTLMAAEKAQVYGWIHENTDPGATIVAYEEADLYLYTERTAVCPIFFSTEYMYTDDKSVIERDLAHITDAASALQARFWLVSEDDFRMEFKAAQPLMKERVLRLMSGLPEVYRSRSGRVRLYDISRMVREAREARRSPGSEWANGLAR